MTDQPMLRSQDALPVVGLILDRHLVFLDVGDSVPLDGDVAETLCRARVTIGPAPAEVLPGIPATHVADCADCQAVADAGCRADLEPATASVGAESVVRAFVRRVGAVAVHIVELDSAQDAPEVLVALCGQVFPAGEPLDRLSLGDGAPCFRCLLRSLPGLTRPRRATRERQTHRTGRSCRRDRFSVDQI
ncbi:MULTISPECIES: hypothetical protein [Actinoalloteichus]|uniref:hypothetical protein n=1 Tax=Actinoalloteichus TaxID=65496 RepID=UPI0012F81172|nr:MULTISPECIES: hypothetical protein [Actinoalloteichus]